MSLSQNLILLTSREVEVITIKTNECFQNMDETSIEEIFKLNSDIVKAAMQSIISLVK
jgi:phosphate transport system protein